MTRAPAPSGPRRNSGPDRRVDYRVSYHVDYRVTYRVSYRVGYRAIISGRPFDAWSPPVGQGVG